MATLQTLTRPVPEEAVRELVIRPRVGWIAVDWRELWVSRELLYFLVLRDVKVRYKQTVLGVAWAVLQPLFTMFVFTIIFGRFAKIPSDGMPYAVFVFAGLLPWTFFSNNISQASQSLLNQQSLLTKIYLPRLYIPASAIGSGLIDLLVSFVVFAMLMVYYGVPVGPGLLALPVLVCPYGSGVFGHRPDPGRAHRHLSRLSLCRAVPGSVVALPEPGHLSREHRPGEIPMVAGVESDGRHHRCLPIRFARPAVESAHACRVDTFVGRVPDVRPLLLSQDRAQLC